MTSPAEIIKREWAEATGHGRAMNFDKALSAAGHAIAPLGDINDLDAVVRALGIEDSVATPAARVEELFHEIERLRARIAEAAGRTGDTREVIPPDLVRRDGGLRYLAPAHGWVCFQCGTTFMTASAAKRHFGSYTISRPPLCITAPELFSDEETPR